jgi:hypothetical protein
MTTVGFCPGCGTARSAGALQCADCGLAFDASPIGAARAGQPVKRRSRLYRGLVWSLAGLLVLLGAGYASTLIGQHGTVSQGSNHVVVTYALTGSATAASLTYTDASGNIEQATNVRVPLTSKTGTPGLTFEANHGSMVSFSAQNTRDFGDLTCTISADGTVINTGRSSGGYAIVSCSGQLP